MNRSLCDRFATLVMGLTAVFLMIGCASSMDAEKQEWRVSEDLFIRRIGEGVWLHTSWRVLEGGTRFPSNGLIVRDGDGVMLVDTAWGEEPTRQLLQWVDGTLRLPVRRAVITHGHDDRIGGASLLVSRNVPMYAHPLTGEVARTGGFPQPTAIVGIEVAGSAADIGAVEVFYPGPAHTRDNIFVWIPSRRILFGGCAVRAAGSTTAGNVADAVIPAWPDSIRRAIDRYGEAEIVVPGHGDPGDGSLLRHTLSIVEGLRVKDEG